VKRFVIGALLFAAATAAAAARVDPEPFFKHPDYGEFKLSPSGKYVAGIVPVNGRTGLVAIDVATRKPGHVATVNVSDIASFDWVNDDRLVFTIIDRQVGAGAQRGSGLYTVKRDGSEFRVLVRPPVIPGQFVYRYTRVLSTLRDGSDVVSSSPTTRTSATPMYTVSTPPPEEGARVARKPGDVVQWLADRQGRVRVAVPEEPGGKGRTYWRASEDDPWQLQEEFAAHQQRYVPVGFDATALSWWRVASRAGTCSRSIASTPSRRSSATVAAHPRRRPRE
jgi:hypothetical protein